MRRIVYLVLGALLGGYAVHRVHRSARALRPGGIAARVQGRVSEYADGVRELGADVQAAAADREAELRDRYGR